MADQGTDSRVAVLVDCDNTSPEILEYAWQVVAQFGRMALACLLMPSLAHASQPTLKPGTALPTLHHQLMQAGWQAAPQTDSEGSHAPDEPIGTERILLQAGYRAVSHCAMDRAVCQLNYRRGSQCLKLWVDGEEPAGMKVSSSSRSCRYFAKATATAPKATSCSLQPVPIEPEGKEPATTYVGHTATLTLRFTNEKTTGPVDAFPEPPLRVTQGPAGTTCTIDDGGIWMRQHVYADAQGRVLATHEYSGSNDSLNFYDTRSCRKLATVDVSNTTWRLGAEGLAIDVQTKAGKQTKRVPLTGACLPAKAAAPRTTP
jgi:hypothetical protein